MAEVSVRVTVSTNRLPGSCVCLFSCRLIPANPATLGRTLAWGCSVACGSVVTAFPLRAWVRRDPYIHTQLASKRHSVLLRGSPPFSNDRLPCLCLGTSERTHFKMQGQLQCAVAKTSQKHNIMNF